MPCVRSVVGRHARACFVVFSLAAMHSFARQGLLQPEDTTLPAPDSSTDAPPGAKYSLLSFPRAPQWADPQQKCTIVELHNRKGCLFEEKSRLPAGMDVVIPTPSSSGSKTNTSGSPFDVPASRPGEQAPWLGQRAPFGPPQSRTWRGRRLTVSEAVELQPLLDARPLGYNGADVAASLPAPPMAGDKGQPHTLWLLGDTFLGRMEGQRRIPGYFVHNSVATMPVWNHPSREADPAQVVFWHGLSPPAPFAATAEEEKDGCPASLFRTPGERVRGDENECHEGGEYLWPVSGLAVDLAAAPSNASASRSFASHLLLLATRWAYLPWIEEDVNMTRSVLNFQVLGTTLVVVDDAHLEPPHWRYRTRDWPGTGPDVNWFQAIALAGEEEGGREGGKQGGLARSENELVFLMGTAPEDSAVAEKGGGKGSTRQILGRVPVKGLLDMTLEGMEVWGRGKAAPAKARAAAQVGATGAKAGDKAGLWRVFLPPAASGAIPSALAGNDGSRSDASEGWGTLSSYMDGSWVATSLLSPVYTGVSLQYSSFLRRWYSVAIDWLGKQALLQTAESITGPWDSTPIYDLPPPFNDSNLMAYTGKAHPELADNENEIVFTYVANTPGVVYPLFEDGADILYVPRFVRIVFDGKEGGKENIRAQRKK